MAYRRLGRTGMMISEIISGGGPIRLHNFKHLDMAIDMGLNYLDMAPSYGRGECEKAYGKLLSASSKRGRVFLTSKISNFGGIRNRLYKEIFDGLPSDKQDAIVRRARDMRRSGGVEKPGYFVEYYPGQGRQFGPAYLSNAMMRDYAHRVEGSLQLIPQWRVDKMQRIVPGDWKAPMKAYLWALQNPNISAVISNLWNEVYVRENLSLAGTNVELQPA